MTLERIGPYRIVRLLGKGGMGAVYEGVHEAIERRVAIKVLHAELARRQDIATRFFNEARAVNRIEHPGLVQISDYGQLPDGMAYIVMEFLKGETLGQRIKRIGGRLPSGDVIRLGRQVASALAAAHDKDIVHRDLKPDNIMIVPNTDVPGGELSKVLDFGIAKVAEAQGGDSEAHTRADALLGTPRYMSPEQCRGGGHTDSKSDVYSLGVIFYELLAGAPPFAGNSHGELIVQHMMQPPPPLAERAEPSAPPQLVQLVMRMLLKEKEARPTMKQVVAELDRMGGYMSGVFGVVSMPAGQSGSSLAAVGALGPGSLPGTGSLPGQPLFPSQPGVGSASHPSQPGQVAMALASMPGIGTMPSLAGQAPPSAPPSTLGLASGQAPPRQRWPIAVAIGSVVGAVAVGVVLVVTLSKPPPPPPPPPPQPPPPAKTETAVTPPPAKKNVRWSLSSQPAGAMVIRQRDGNILGVTPLTLNNPVGEGSEALRIVLQGYAEETVQPELDKDFEQRVELRKTKAREKGRKKGYEKGNLTVVD